MADLVQLQDSMIPASVARIPARGLAVPSPISSYFKVLRPSTTTPGNGVRKFIVPEAFDSKKLLCYVSEIKLSPNTPTPEYTENLSDNSVEIVSSLTPNSLDRVRFTYVKFGAFSTFWQFNDLPKEAPDGSRTTFHTKRPVRFDDRMVSGQHVYYPCLFAWVTGIQVPVTFTPPDTITLAFAPRADEVLELLFLPEY